MALSYARHPYKKNLWSLFLDEQDWREVHPLLFKEKDLRGLVGLQEADFFSLEYRAAKSFSLRKLAQRNYSTYEMRKTLEKHLVSLETIERVIAECLELGYIDDADWISCFIRRCEARNLSQNAVLQKLQAKGLSSEEVKVRFGHLMKETSGEQAIRKLLETKYKNRDLNDYKERQKLIAALIRRGFQYEEIHRVFVSA